MKLLAAFLFCVRLMALPISLSDGNSTAVVETDGVLGLSSWVIDGVENGFEQSYWYRTDPFNYEQPITSLPLLNTSSTQSTLALIYGNDSLQIEVNYTLTGGLPNTRRSLIQEQVILRNLTGGDMPVAFFVDTDFNVNGTPENDFLEGGVQGILQSERPFRLRVSGNPMPDRFEIAPFPDLFLSLADLSPTTLSNSGSPFGPGDAGSAFQWDLLLSPQSQVTIDINKESIPEPSTWLLTLGGLLIVLSRTGTIATGRR